jgi:hypothetical protein
MTHGAKYWINLGKQQTLKDVLKIIDIQINKTQEAREKLRKLSYVSKEDERIDNILYHKVCGFYDLKAQIEKELGEMNK